MHALRQHCRVLALLCLSACLGPMALAQPAAPPFTLPGTNPPAAGPAVATATPKPAAPQPPAQTQQDPLLRKDSPRRLLETFYFCLEGIDYKPELIEEAARCLDSRLLTEADANLDLTALHLGEILNVLNIPLTAAPEITTQEQVMLVNEEGCKIVMVKGPDGNWKFQAETVQKVSEMRRNLKTRTKTDGGERQFVEAFRSPEATFRTFRQAVARNDFATAATCLDNAGNSQQLWDIRGPVLARELAFVVQRLGFVYSEELPGESSGNTHCWRVIPAGQVTFQRVSLPDGRLAWKFSRATLEGLPKLIAHLRQNQIDADPRWKRLGLALDTTVLKEIGAKADKEARRATGKGTMKPATGTTAIDPVAGRQTPRAAVITFLKLCEELRVRTEVRENLHASMDLEPLEDQLGRRMPGTQAALMIEAILRAIDLNLNTLSDIANDEPQTIRGGQDLSLTLRRMKDGAWRFDQDTLLRLRDMYNKLTPAQRTGRDRLHDFLTARETYASFTWAIHKGNMDQAVEALDLSAIPAAAQGVLGHRLAWKLRYVLDRNRYVLPQEVPGQADGRRWLAFRTTSGDMIQIGKRESDPNKDHWLFTPETIEAVEDLFPKMIGEPPLPEVADSFWYRDGPDFWESPSVWIHLRVPQALRKQHLGLADWQWLGIVIGLMVSWLTGLAAAIFVRLCVRPFLKHSRSGLDESLLGKRTRPIQWLIGYGMMLLAVNMLDLPLDFMKGLLPITITGWLLLAFLVGHNLIDLGLEIYNHRPTREERASLRDLMAPTLTLVLKAVLVFIFGYWLISLLGNPGLLTQILAGMGIVGLAVSLAAQDAIKHFFGTLLLISEGPFKIGDRIIIDKFRGVVEVVGFRSTRIRTDKGTLLVLPNSVLAGGSVENLGRRNRHFTRMMIPVLELPDSATLEMLTKRVQSICRELMPSMKSSAKVDIVQAEEGKPPAIRVRTWLPGWGGIKADTAKAMLQDSVANAATELGLVPLVDMAPWPASRGSVANAA